MSQNNRETNSHSLIFIIVGILILFLAGYFITPLLFTDKATQPPPTIETIAKPVNEEIPLTVEDVEITSESNSELEEKVSPTESTQTSSQAELSPSLSPSMKKEEVVKVYEEELYNSDRDVLIYFKQLITNEHQQKYLLKTNIISNFVVFTDNVAKGEFLAQFSPVHKPLSSFQVLHQDGKILLDPQSYQRYTPYAEMIENVDIDILISQYAYFKPLIDAAYQEMGYDAGDFNWTTKDAIDEVLDTPLIRYQIELKAPSAMYLYQDEHLESLSDVQKLLIRMGPENTLKIQNKLKQIKKALDNKH
jgi:hypothetical protein